jgi:hypothetical protein
VNIWQLNRLLNAVVLVVGGLALAVILFAFVSSQIGPNSDPHGWAIAFTVVFGAMIVPPLALSIAAAVALRRRRRTGFVYQLVTGATLGLYGVFGMDTLGGLLGIGLGVAIVAFAISGLRGTAATPVTEHPKAEQ